MSGVELLLAQFHDALGDERGRGNAELRFALHREEHDELLAELATEHGYDSEVDRGKLARELADVVYVAYGTAHAFAIDLDVALLEIHRAAMEKLDPYCARCEGEGSYSEPCTTSGPDCTCNGDRVLVDPCPVCSGTGKGERVVREDGKILKPPGFVPPDMSRAVL